MFELLYMCASFHMPQLNRQLLYPPFFKKYFVDFSTGMDTTYLIANNTSEKLSNVDNGEDLISGTP